MIEIDEGHILCPFHYNPEIGTSIIKKTLQDVIPDNVPLEKVTYPFEILSTFEDEMDKQLRLKILSVAEKLFVNIPKTAPTLFSNISSGFSHYFGVEIPNGRGWNILGNAISPIVKQTLSRNRIEKVIERLYSKYKKTFSIELYASKSLFDIERELRYEECIPMESDLKYDFYLYEMYYPGTLVHYMQKRLTFRTKIWKHRKIVTTLQADLMRESRLPFTDDVYVAHLFLNDFYQDRLPLSHRSRQILAEPEHEYTNTEISLFSAYIPHYEYQKYHCILPNHPLHPETAFPTYYDGYDFPNRLYIFHYEILKLFVSSEEAFNLCFYFHGKHEWELFLQRLLHEKFYINCYDAMENIDLRIALLELGNDDFEIPSYYPSIISSSYMTKVYKEIQREILQSLPVSNKIEFEKVIYCLQKWFEIWKCNLSESSLIFFFFELFFSLDTHSLKTEHSNSLVSISFIEKNSHEMTVQLFEKISFSITSTEISFQHMVDCFQKHVFSLDESKEKSNIRGKLNEVRNLVEKFETFFSIHLETLPTFEDCTIPLNWDEYCCISQFSTKIDN
jgi:hypothetical protein